MSYLSNMRRFMKGGLNSITRSIARTTKENALVNNPTNMRKINFKI